MSITGHPEFSSLLAAVKDQPRDSAARLVLADWLEEFGDEHDKARAELMRLHCQPHRVHLGHSARDEHSRQRELLARHHAAWLGPLDRQPLRWEIHGGLLTLPVLHDQLLAALSLLKELAEQAPRHWAWVEELQVREFHAENLIPRPEQPALAGFTCLNLGYTRRGPS